MAKFLKKEQEEVVVEAIKEAEKETSGEIRVHIERACKAETPLERAKEIFADLNMYETEFRNGVIIYVATDDHRVAIWGDEGIHTKVGQQFWDEELELMIKYFRAGDYESGLRDAILEIGKKLKEFFPYEQKGAVNELSNEISYKKDSSDSDA